MMKVYELLNKRFDGIPFWSFALRLGLMAGQIILVVCLGRKGVLFFYQAF